MRELTIVELDAVNGGVDQCPAPQGWGTVGSGSTGTPDDEYPAPRVRYEQDL